MGDELRQIPSPRDLDNRHHGGQRLPRGHEEVRAPVPSRPGRSRDQGRACLPTAAQEQAEDPSRYREGQGCQGEEGQINASPPLYPGSELKRGGTSIGAFLRWCGYGWRLSRSAASMASRHWGRGGRAGEKYDSCCLLSPPAFFFHNGRDSGFGAAGGKTDGLYDPFYTSMNQWCFGFQTRTTSRFANG